MNMLHSTGFVCRINVAKAKQKTEDATRQAKNHIAHDRYPSEI